MNTFQLTCFLALSETLNFAKAAERLSITQPAVTRQIKALESELNVKPFKRTTRTAELTHAGFAFINDARGILEISVRAQKRFEHPEIREILPFSAGCQSHMQFFSFPKALKKLHDLHPDLHPRFHVGPLQHLRRMFEEESLDIILSFKEPDMKKTPAVYRELKTIPIVCACAPGHRLSSWKSVHASDLAGEKLLLTDPVRTPEGIARFQGSLLSGRSPSDFHFCDSPEAAMVLAQAGFGVSILPELFLPLDSSLCRPPIEEAERISFGIYGREFRKGTVSLDFFQIMKQEFEES